MNRDTHTNTTQLQLTEPGQLHAPAMLLFNNEYFIYFRGELNNQLRNYSLNRVAVTVAARKVDRERNTQVLTVTLPSESHDRSYRRYCNS